MKKIVKMSFMDQKGYVLSGFTFLLMIPAILIMVAFADMSRTGGESVSAVLQSDTTFYAVNDVEKNVAIIATDVMRETADNITLTGIPLTDSRSTLKYSLQTKINDFTENYAENIGADEVTCTILKVDSAPDPFKIEIKFEIHVKKGRTAHNETINQFIDINDKQVPDPMPFIKLKAFGIPKRDNNKGLIVYGSSLSDFLSSRELENAEIYNGSTSPLFIKKCPYDPYVSHGNGNSFTVLKNCIFNKYFHESSDGSCFMCKLEGKATCPHYGIETFIIPPVSPNSSQIKAPCSIDHVIFNESTYPGTELEYYCEANNHYMLFLDDGHRQKYGLPKY